MKKSRQQIPLELDYIENKYFSKIEHPFFEDTSITVPFYTRKMIDEYYRRKKEGWATLYVCEMSSHNDNLRWEVTEKYGILYKTLNEDSRIHTPYCYIGNVQKNVINSPNTFGFLVLNYHLDKILPAFRYTR